MERIYATESGSKGELTGREYQQLCGQRHAAAIGRHWFAVDSFKAYNSIAMGTVGGEPAFAEPTEWLCRQGACACKVDRCEQGSGSA